MQRESETAVTLTLPTPAPALGNDGLPVVTFHLGTPLRNEAIFELAQTFDEQQPGFRFQVSTRWPTAATADVLNVAQSQAENYLACLGQAQSSTPNVILECAKLADTGFVRPFNWDVGGGDVD